MPAVLGTPGWALFQAHRFVAARDGGQGIRRWQFQIENQRALGDAIIVATRPTMLNKIGQIDRELPPGTSLRSPRRTPTFPTRHSA